jgi:hypothetical protein
MFKKIENPAACEMRSVIRFLNAKNMKPAEIHLQLCDVYGEHAMSSLMVWRWVRLFNEGRENVHDDLQSHNAKSHHIWLGAIRSSPELAPSDFHLFLHLKPFLAGRHSMTKMRSKKPLPSALHCRRYHSTIKGYKKWCNAMTSASKLVETMLKNSVQYVHQMVCNVLLFFS